MNADKTTVIRAPASLSNLGAGFDCLGLALDLWLEVRLAPRAGLPTYGGTLAGLDARRDLVLAALGDTIPRGYRLEVHSEIPVSRGLGSSGAAAVAGVALARRMADKPTDRNATYAEAYRIEGHPDNVGPAAFGGLVLATDEPRKLRLHPRFAIACAIPETTVDTRDARAILPSRVSRRTAVEQARRAGALVLGLTGGDADLVAYGMDDLIAVPHRKVLIRNFDAAGRAGLACGAFGVTISGSGSTVMAICPEESALRVAEAMAHALSGEGNAVTALVPQVSDEGFEVSCRRGGDRGD